jgi:hypothetical protein
VEILNRAEQGAKLLCPVLFTCNYIYIYIKVKVKSVCGSFSTYA